MKTVELRGVMITAPEQNVDFVGRCFFPKIYVDEDPVTGCAHFELAPYWARNLSKISPKLSRYLQKSS
jgi:predicted PhzF superfamily epimerase YddE/YHI9